MPASSKLKLPGLLTPSAAYKPFRYPWAYDMWKRQQQVHWMPEEVPLGEDMPGAPMTSVLDAAWFAAHPLTRVPTHDNDAWREVHARLKAESVDLDERLEQLRALGYIR